MSINECNRLHQQIIKKINNLPPEPLNSNTLIGNLSNNFTYISNNFTYNLSNISANFSSSINYNGSLKSNSQSLNEQQIKQANQNGKLLTSNSLALINGNNKLSTNSINGNKSSPNSINGSKSPTLSNSISNSKLTINDDTNSINSTNGLNKSPKQNNTFNSVFYTSNSSLNPNNSIVQLNNTKLDEELIDLILKLNEKCEFLNQYGIRHDYTGKQVIKFYFNL